VPKIDFEELEDMWEGASSKAPIRPNTSPTGSLTDNRRVVKSQRDGAIKRLRQFKERSREM
jgi:hypothetical protein